MSKNLTKRTLLHLEETYSLNPKKMKDVSKYEAGRYGAFFT